MELQLKRLRKLYETCRTLHRTIAITHHSDEQSYLVNTQGSKRQRLAGFSVNQENFTVQNQITPTRKCLWDEVFEMVHLDIREIDEVITRVTIFSAPCGAGLV